MNPEVAKQFYLVEYICSLYDSGLRQCDISAIVELPVRTIGRCLRDCGYWFGRLRDESQSYFKYDWSCPIVDTTQMTYL